MINKTVLSSAIKYKHKKFLQEPVSDPESSFCFSEIKIPAKTIFHIPVVHYECKKISCSFD
ncbi:hypothetical protein BOQ62_14250 [Chryseobacterium sp. CH21]|nr:hypothetical protein BOQ62_14250 [Chryseobacterium sp. CH21]